MKTFLKDILVFLIPIVLVFAATEVFYRTVDNSYTLKHEQIQKQANSIETLILGDSQSFFGINPMYFNIPAFNLANISQPLYFDGLLLFNYIDDLPNLKTVVLSVGVNSLSDRMDSFDMSWRQYFYNTHMDLEGPHISNYNIGKYSLALTRRFKKTVQTIKTYIEDGSLVGCDKNGWGNYYFAEESLDLEKTAKYAIQVHNDDNFDYDANIERLDKLIKFCELKKVDVVIVFMPVSDVFAKGIKDRKEKKSDSVFSSIVNRYNHVSYYNLYNDGTFKDADFYDANHLNTQGAVKCSKIINNFLNSSKN